jgi:hypothetical protein
VAAVTVVALYTLTIALTGGFSIQVAGIRVRSHSWVRPGLVALACVAMLALTVRDRLPSISLHLSRVLESAGFATWLALSAMGWALSSGVGFGTFASGGADSYGYIGQARLLAHGHLTDTLPLSAGFTWPDVEYTLTPLGFTGGRTPGVIAPKYPPGLPLLLAPLAAFSERAIYLVVPVFGALLVWTTYRLGAALGDPLAGAMAAVRDRLPAGAFVLAAQHSGSIRYYANRPTLRWDLLSPTRLDEVVAALRAQGYEPFLVVDAGEYEDFREKFALTGQHAVRQLTPLAVLGDARVFGFR